jgi:hypothetical protein
VKGIEDQNFWAEKTNEGKFVGRVKDFPQLRTRPKHKRLDAVDDIITQTAAKLRDLAEAKATA